LFGRNICFKNYVSGSYVGDLEFITKNRRLFSVRAEYDTTLIVISPEVLERVFFSDPQSHLDLYRRAIKRYLHYKQSMKKASYYEKITKNSQWWTSAHQIHDNDLNMYNRLDRFFSVIAENNQHLHMTSGEKLTIRMNSSYSEKKKFRSSQHIEIPSQFRVEDRLKDRSRTVVIQYPEIKIIPEDSQIPFGEPIGKNEQGLAESQKSQSDDEQDVFSSIPGAHIVSSYVIDMSNMIAQFNNTLDLINNVLSNPTQEINQRPKMT